MSQISSNGKRKVIRGVSVVPGLSVGVVHNYRDVLSRKFSVNYLKDHELRGEIHRFRKALEIARKEILDVGALIEDNLDKNSAQIFSFQYLSLKDREFIEEVEQEIYRRKVNAEAVVKDVFARKISEIHNNGSIKLQQTSDDLNDSMRFLLKALLDTQNALKVKGGRRLIITAKRLLPSDAVHFNARAISGIVTATGGQDSHIALLAREYSIPFVSNVDLEENLLTDGTRVIINAEEGKIVLNPPPREIKAAENAIAHRKEELKRVVSRTRNRKISYNGEPINIFANTFGPADVNMSLRYGAQGIGLYRVEGLYMSMRREPGAEQLFDILNQSLVKLKDKPVTLRLLDTGADKTIPSVSMDFDDSGPLGLRGIRLLFKNESLLRTQLSAFLRLSQFYDIRILIPLVTTSMDVKKTKTMLEEEKNKLIDSGVKLKNDPQIGAMIETPAAVAIADEIIEIVDFVSIGTNDLIQYTMVLDRDDPSFEEYRSEGIKIVFPMIRSVLEKSQARGKSCAVCGEIAGDTDYTKALLDAGLNNFSVTSSTIPFLKEKILSFSKKA
ncbi:Phosphoenolpyruvate-protein phosphotransferase of PTS system [Chitinispirillum alkaliphilum]|nr:Phosphoenolpyruvate-protein phosphotransferase of PTS system [Chitinispirillum alkaliphilum]